MTENRLPPLKEVPAEPRPFPTTVDQLAWMLLPAFLPEHYNMLRQAYVNDCQNGKLALPNGAGNGGIIAIDIANLPWTDSKFEAMAIQLAYRTAHRMIRYGAHCAENSLTAGVAPVPDLIAQPPQG